MTKKKIKDTLVSLLLDRSGSMESCRAETISGFNEYIEGIKSGKKGNVKFNFVQFDTTSIDKIYIGEDIENVIPLTAETYVPRGGTPLIDAAMKTILATEEYLKESNEKSWNVMFIMQTDGHENSSDEYTNKDLHKKIKELTEAGWQFIFLGANIDAYAQAEKFGISTGKTVSYNKNLSGQTFDSLRANTVRYSNTGEAASTDFSVEQKSSSGDPTAGSNGDKKSNPNKIDTSTGSGNKGDDSIVDDISFTS